MQGIAIAISPSGITVLMEQLIGPQIAAGLLTLNQPNSVPPFNMSQPTWSQEGHGYTESWSDYKLALTNGSFTTFDPVYSGCQQTDDSFLITNSAPTTVVSYIWNEKCVQTFYPAPVGESGTTDIGPTDYTYTQSFSTFDVFVTAALAYSNNAYTVSATTTSSVGTETATIPKKSVLLTQSDSACVSGNASTQAETALGDINYNKLVTTALANVFATIPATGVTGGVTFEFEPSPNAPTYPSGGGIQLGVTGDVEVNGTRYSSVSPHPADVVLPSLPVAPDTVAYNIQDYVINGLFWGWTQVGTLDLTVTEANISSAYQYVLKTSSYGSGPLNALNQPPYEDQQMSAGLTPLSTPTIVFQDVYEVTAQSISSIQATLTSEGVWTDSMATALSDLANQVYIILSDFETAVEAQGGGVLAPYVQTVVADSTVTGGVLSQDVQCVMSVLLDPPVPVLTFDVKQQYVMTDIGIGPVSDGDAQSLTFAFNSAEDCPPTGTFVSSNLTGVTKKSWKQGNIWFALEGNWNTAVTGIGLQGVALPRLQGFEFQSESATVTINPPANGDVGYAAVLADIVYTGAS